MPARKGILKPSKPPAQVKGLKEIPQHAYLIRNGNRAYIFSGRPSELKAAVEHVSLIPDNIGNATSWKTLVS